MPKQIVSFDQLAQADRPIRIGFFLIPDFPLMTFSAALDPCGREIDWQRRLLLNGC